MALASDRQKCSHLLRRFGLGASEAELDYYLKDGFAGAVDKLLGYSAVDEGFAIELSSLASPQNDRVPMGALVDWWVARMVMTRRPVQEKMTLFWHDHFATSAEKVTAEPMMAAQNEVIRRNATGNFRTLLREVSKDPAMILWLDNQLNVKGHANENFAREVMELFTLGIGHYQEKDVLEGARAFTGWSIKRSGRGKAAVAEFMFRPFQHDDGDKDFLGNHGAFDGDQILDILCDNPRSSEFITWKLWRWFAYEDPEPTLVTRLAKVFRDNSLEIQPLLRAMMLSPEFYSPKADRKLFKNPVDFCVTTLRQLGVGEQMGGVLRETQGDFPRAALVPAASAQVSMKGMGMWLMYPPDVSGWKPGPGWITSATMVERISWGDKLFSLAPGVKSPIRYPAWPLFQADPTPEGATQRLLSIFDANVTEDHQKILVAAAKKESNGKVTPQTANAVAAATTRLIFACPEFQFA
jgi:uncharacterized protein (DUF1800 family)